MRGPLPALATALAVGLSTLAPVSCASASPPDTPTVSPTTPATVATDPGRGPGHLVDATDTEVTFTVDGTTTYGTLHVPAHRAGQHLPAALLLPGSGPTDRNGNQPPTLTPGTLAQISAALGRDDVATLRFDKYASGRTGLGAYQEHPETIDFPAFARQAAAAYALLARNPVTDRRAMYVVGHSEGALTALYLATQPLTPPAGTATTGEATSATGEATSATGEATSATGEATSATGEATSATGEATSATGEATSATGAAGLRPRPAGLALLQPQAMRLLDVLARQLHAQIAAAAQAGQFTATEQRTIDAAVDTAVADLRARRPLDTATMPPSLAQLFRSLQGVNERFVLSDDAIDPPALARQVSRRTRILVTCGSEDPQVPCDSTDRLTEALREAAPGGPGRIVLQGVGHFLTAPGTDDTLEPVLVQALRELVRPARH